MLLKRHLFFHPYLTHDSVTSWLGVTLGKVHVGYACNIIKTGCNCKFPKVTLMLFAVTRRNWEARNNVTTVQRASTVTPLIWHKLAVPVMLGTTVPTDQEAPKRLAKTIWFSWFDIFLRTVRLTARGHPVSRLSWFNLVTGSSVRAGWSTKISRKISRKYRLTTELNKISQNSLSENIRCKHGVGWP